MDGNKCRQSLAQLDQRIAALLSDCETVDQAESDQGSFVHLEQALADQTTLRSRIEAVLARLEAEGRTSLNTTDADCVRIHSRQGSHAGYSGQIAVDDAHGLIIHSDVVAENNDSKQFANQLDQANAVLDEPCKAACADAGFADYETLNTVDLDQTDVIVAPQTSSTPATDTPFDKSHFIYNESDDTYTCPEGHCLTCKGFDSKKHSYSYYGGAVCRTCKHFGRCTTNRLQGRKVRRYEFEELRTSLEQRYHEPDAQAIFARRKARVEHPFGHFKRNLEAGYFLLRGLAGVRAEMSLLAGCFNIRRMISLLGVTGMVAVLGNYPAK